MKLFSNFFLFSMLMLLTSCSSLNYIEKNHEKNIEKIKNCAPYNSEPVNFEIKNLVDSERAAEIRAYFRKNAGLDLDALAASEKTTWEKSVELAVFVAKNIPHDNQKEFLQERNAITLWEYSRRVSSGFNCRWHATILSELLLSIGIKNRFITCLPEDKNDGDCHVVNNIWLPELGKWAMLDSDMLEFVIDDNNIPMSLAQMREAVRQGKALNVNVLPGFENSWVAKESGKKYMQAYWAKNLYWFSAHATYGFDLEGKRNLPDFYTCLVPSDFDYSSAYSDNYATSNSAAFWD